MKTIIAIIVIGAALHAAAAWATQTGEAIASKHSTQYVK